VTSRYSRINDRRFSIPDRSAIAVAALSRVLPPARWPMFAVTPQPLLR
jgi:hypothetical protein